MNNAAPFFSLIKKRWAILVGVYTALFFLGEMTIAGYATNSFLFELGLICAMCAIVLWTISGAIAYPKRNTATKFIYRKMQIDALQGNTRIWMTLHVIFRAIEFIAIFIAFLVFMISITFEQVAEKRPYYLVAFLLASCLIFPYFHRVRNVLRMGYLDVEGASTFGARAFASLASSLLADQNPDGINYLHMALRMMKGIFDSKKIEPEKIEEAMETISIATQVETNFSKEPFAILSNDLAQETTFPNIPDVLQKFIDSKELEFVKKFKIVKKPKTRNLWIERLSFLAIFITAVGTITQALIPEDTKKLIVDFLVRIFGSPTIFMFAIGGVLFLLLAHYANRFSDAAVKHRDLKKMTDSTHISFKAHETEASFRYGSSSSGKLSVVNIKQWYQKLGGKIEPDTEIQFALHFPWSPYAKTALTEKMPPAYLCEGSISCYLRQPSRHQTDVIALSVYRDTTAGAQDSSMGIHRNLFLQYEIAGATPAQTDGIPNRHIPLREDITIKAFVNEKEIKSVRIGARG